MVSINPKTFSLVLKLLYAFYIAIQVFTKIYKMVCGTNSAIRAGVITLVNASETREPNKTADAERVHRAQDIYDSCAESVDNFYMVSSEGAVDVASCWFRKSIWLVTFSSCSLLFSTELCS